MTKSDNPNRKETMTATSPELSVELIENVLREKEAALAKEQAMLEDLKGLLSRMGYELVPAAQNKVRRGRSLSAPSSVPTGAAPAGRGRGRPRKDGTVPSPSSETVAG